MRNGIPAAGLSELAHEIRDDAGQGIASYGVSVRWLSGTRAQVVTTLPMRIGAHRVNRDFSWMIDEPRQLGGANHAPNPQEYLLSGLGACLMVGFAVGATVMGIQLSTLSRSRSRRASTWRAFSARARARPCRSPASSTRSGSTATARPEQFERLREQAEAHSPECDVARAWRAADGLRRRGCGRLIAHRGEDHDDEPADRPLGGIEMGAAARGALPRRRRPGRDARVAGRAGLFAGRGRRAGRAHASSSTRCRTRRAASRSPGGRRATRPTSTRSRCRNRRRFPGQLEIEQRLAAIMRWNALAMVVRQRALRRTRRPHRELCLGGRPVRGRFQPLLPRAQA